MIQKLLLTSFYVFLITFEEFPIHIDYFDIFKKILGSSKSVFSAVLFKLERLWKTKKPLCYFSQIVY